MRRRSGLYPRKPLIWALTVLVALSLLAVLVDGMAVLWQIGGILVFAAAMADLVILRSQRTPTVERLVDPNLPLGARRPVRLKLRNPGRQILTFRVHDHYPDDFAIEGMPGTATLDSRRSATIRYTVIAKARGDHYFNATDLALKSALGFWSRVIRIDNSELVRVFPNFGELSRYALLAARNRLSTAGVRRRQRRGQGSEFHQLREYQQGDSLRQVDWKATARYRKLIAKEYREEQDQQLFFMLDCGQRMRHRDQAHAHLDSALNALLLAAHVAAKQGDAVGFMTFAGSERFLAPRKGVGVVPALLRASYDIESSTRAADFLRAADAFMAKRLQRALVVLVTNTRDGDQDDLMLAVRLMQKKHLVIVADMRESILDECIDSPVEDSSGALNYMTAHALRESRARTHETMRHQGAVVIDILPQQLPLALVNEYFDIKRSARL